MDPFSRHHRRGRRRQHRLPRLRYALDQLRRLLDYSLLDDSDLPRRFLGADYTPGFNFFTKHTEYDNVDQTAGLAAGYAFARLALGLNQDYSRLAVKSSDIGGRITRAVYDTKLRGRYALTDRSAFEVNLGYYLLDYPDQTYQGYQEVRNEDWFNHLVGARLEAGVGAAFGFVYPQASANQTYQQLLVRGNYRLSGKVNILANLGLELREYDSDQSDTAQSGLQPGGRLPAPVLHHLHPRRPSPEPTLLR